MIRRASTLLLTCAWLLGVGGCYYFGPVDPCDDQDPVPDDYEFVRCDPANAEVLVLSDPFQTIPIRCDVTGAAEIKWWLVPAQGDDPRIVAMDVPSYDLTGQHVAWEPGDEGQDHILRVESKSTLSSPGPEDTVFWWIRFQESTP